MRISRDISASLFLSSFFFFSISVRISFSYRSSVVVRRRFLTSSVESLAIVSSLVLISSCFFSREARVSSMVVSFCLSPFCFSSSSSYFLSIFCSFSESRFSCSTAACFRSRISLRASSISLRRLDAIVSARAITSFHLFSASSMILFPESFCCFCIKKYVQIPPKIAPIRRETNINRFIC